MLSVLRSILKPFSLAELSAQVSTTLFDEVTAVRLEGAVGTALYVIAVEIFEVDVPAELYATTSYEYVWSAVSPVSL